MQRKYFLSYFFLLLFIGSAILKGDAQTALEKTSPNPEEISKIALAIAQTPENLALHEQYLKATQFSKWGVKEDPAFIKQYEDWMVKFPKSATIPYALGHAFASKESPKAKP